jgi:hypothetical protein
MAGSGRCGIHWVSIETLEYISCVGHQWSMHLIQRTFRPVAQLILEFEEAGKENTVQSGDLRHAEQVNK